MKNAIISRKPLSETEMSVNGFLELAGVKFEAVYFGKSMKDNWQCDNWMVFFSKGKEKQGFEFNTGIGHRELLKSFRSYGNSDFDNRRKEAAKRPVFPNAASILHSLVLDSSAIDTSFTYWASEYGYDEDSIKALNIYQECCENAKKLKNIFTRQQIAHMQELLQDY